jgi:hypothetical protein
MGHSDCGGHGLRTGARQLHGVQYALHRYGAGGGSYGGGGYYGGCYQGFYNQGYYNQGSGPGLAAGVIGGAMGAVLGQQAS